MVSPKEVPSIKDDLKALADDIKVRYPVVEERWVVVEQTPSWDDEGYWGSVYHPAENHEVSPYFDTEEKAKAWMDMHVADKGKRLFVQHQSKRQITYYAWWNA